jgi:RNA polymerase sigma-70 factor (ECF subfamily)
MAPESEEELVELIRGGAFERAATRALERYGEELYGFLVNLVGNESDALEVYSQVGEDLWNGLPSFGQRCSIRTWLYVLAHHAAARFRRSPWNRAARRAGDSRLDDVIARTRSRTQPWLRTDVKDGFAALRESLELEDRTLLILRVDRDLSWKDVARVTLDDDSPDEAALRREVNRLSKRFQLLKEELRRRARETGLIEEES